MNGGDAPGAGADEGARELRRQLAGTVSSAAGAYGYTIALGGSIAQAAHRLGGPVLGDALALMGGAVAAFVLLEALARGVRRPTASPRETHVSIWGNAHLLSAGGALCAAALIVRIAQGWPAWLLTGFAVTGLYFLLTAVQKTAVAALRGRA
ncbi:hypothetical protein [Miltoncostaea marina]|uniref:hypothetical protein n=1 Tax=Miltoncostaea marina TaxID=2843215 RepID=UPI001C3C4391|nr:hypothetical protein [Miltoncostaea marina]